MLISSKLGGMYCLLTTMSHLSLSTLLMACLHLLSTKCDVTGWHSSAVGHVGFHVALMHLDRAQLTGAGEPVLLAGELQRFLLVKVLG